MKKESVQKDYDPLLGQMESLFVNNYSLGQITAYCNRFNPIKVMKMESMEIRHSAILGWLLNPRETHGFGDAFLKAFLAQAMSGHKDSAPNALDIIKSDFSDAEVRLEWKKIDTFIRSDSNSYCFVIENKFKSPHREEQLKGYITIAKNIYQKHNVYGIFLTLNEIKLKDTSYKSIKYEYVGGILKRLIQQNESKMSVEIKTFLIHYLEIIEEECDMSEEKNEMKKLARELYLQHKSAIDFVIEHGKSTEFIVAFEEIKRKFDKDGYYWGGLTSDRGSFLPKKWRGEFKKEEIKWDGCEKWWMGFPLICWFQIFPHQDGIKGTLKLYAEVGPCKNRKELIDLISSIQQQTDAGGDKKSSKIAFQKIAGEDGVKYSKFFKNNSEEIKDINNSEEIAEKMEELLKSFESIFNEVALIIPKFLENLN